MPRKQTLGCKDYTTYRRKAKTATLTRFPMTDSVLDHVTLGFDLLRNMSKLLARSQNTTYRDFDQGIITRYFNGRGSLHKTKWITGKSRRKRTSDLERFTGGGDATCCDFRLPIPVIGIEAEPHPPTGSASSSLDISIGVQVR